MAICHSSKLPQPQLTVPVLGGDRVSQRWILVRLHKAMVLARPLDSRCKHQMHQMQHRQESLGGRWSSYLLMNFKNTYFLAGIFLLVQLSTFHASMAAWASPPSRVMMQTIELTGSTVLFEADCWCGQARPFQGTQLHFVLRVKSLGRHRHVFPSRFQRGHCLSLHLEDSFQVLPSLSQKYNYPSFLAHCRLQ